MQSVVARGPTEEGDPLELLAGWTFPERLTPIADEIQPESITVFGGALDEANLNLAERLIVRGVKAPIGDFRDWSAIQSWAGGIGESLQSRPV